MYVSFGQTEVNHLQPIPNAAARLLMGTEKYTHVMLLSSLRWLLVRYRIAINILCGLAPEYLSVFVRVHKLSRVLRSVDHMVLYVS